MGRFLCAHPTHWHGFAPVNPIGSSWLRQTRSSYPHRQSRKELCPVSVASKRQPRGPSPLHWVARLSHGVPRGLVGEEEDHDGARTEPAQHGTEHVLVLQRVHLHTEGGGRGGRVRRRAEGDGWMTPEVHVDWGGVCGVWRYLECLEDLLSATVPEGVERGGAQRRPCMHHRHRGRERKDATCQRGAVW